MSSDQKAPSDLNSGLCSSFSSLQKDIRKHEEEIKELEKEIENSSDSSSSISDCEFTVVQESVGCSLKENGKDMNEYVKD